MDNDATKKCVRCKLYQPLSNFGVDRSRVDRKQPLCRECKRKSFATPTSVDCSVCRQPFLERQDTVNAKKRAGKRFVCPSCREAARPTEDDKKRTRQAGAKRYYRRYKSLVIERAGDRRHESREYTWSIKEASPCQDCGKFYPHYVMEFDHVKGKKKADLSQLSGRGYSRKTLDEEIAKCELVCANCHRERTFRRRREQNKI